MLLQKLEESTVHSLHLVIKDNKIHSQQSPYSQLQTSAGPSGYSPPPFQPRPTPQVHSSTLCGLFCQLHGVTQGLYDICLDTVQHTMCHAAPCSVVSMRVCFPPTRQGAQADTAQARSAQPQNAAMLAAYQAALDTFVNNRQPQQAGPQGQQQRPEAAQSAPQPGSTAQPQSAQGQQPNQSNAPAQNQAPMYAVHAPAMLAYIPVLVSFHITIRMGF